MNKRRKRRKWRDITKDPQFIEQEADRLLMWECVHTGYCASKHLRPSLMAERLGIPIQTVYAIIEGATNKLAHKAHE